jgi:hypothetical protein
MSMASIKNGPGIERKISASISDAAVLREIRRSVTCVNGKACHQENRVAPQLIQPNQSVDPCAHSEN